MVQRRWNMLLKGLEALLLGALGLGLVVWLWPTLNPPMVRERVTRRLPVALLAAQPVWKVEEAYNVVVSSAELELGEANEGDELGAGSGRQREKRIKKQRKRKANAEKRRPEVVWFDKATQVQLEALPSVGPVLAQKLLMARRSQAGGLRCWSQVDAVPGVGEKMLKRLRPWLKGLEECAIVTPGKTSAEVLVLASEGKQVGKPGIEKQKESFVVVKSDSLGDEEDVKTPVKVKKKRRKKALVAEASFVVGTPSPVEALAEGEVPSEAR